MATEILTKEPDDQHYLHELCVCEAYARAAALLIRDDGAEDAQLLLLDLFLRLGRLHTALEQRLSGGSARP